MELTTFSSSSELDSFYEKKFYFSYSSLSKLLECPEIFYKEYILGDKEQLSAAYLTEGKIIHALLLEPDKVDDMFIVMEGKLPSDNLITVVERVFEHHLELQRMGDSRTQLSEFGDAVLDVLRDINLYQSLKTDQQRHEKVTGNPDVVTYWNFLKRKGEKMIVDAPTMEKCKAIVDKIKRDPVIIDLLKLNHKDDWWKAEEVHNERMLQIDLKKFPFGIKGMLDSIVIDAGSGVIRITDIKTTSKSLKEFPESLKTYRYSVQAAMYNLLALNTYADLVKQGYKVEFRFLVIDKNRQYYPFLVSQETMKEWTKDLQQVFTQAEYHYTSKDYTLPYEFAKGEYTL
jgi:RecB family exonuclease